MQAQSSEYSCQVKAVRKLEFQPNKYVEEGIFHSEQPLIDLLIFRILLSSVKIPWQFFSPIFAPNLQ